MLFLLKSWVILLTNGQLTFILIKIRTSYFPGWLHMYSTIGPRFQKNSRLYFQNPHPAVGRRRPTLSRRRRSKTKRHCRITTGYVWHWQTITHTAYVIPAHHPLWYYLLRLCRTLRNSFSMSADVGRPSADSRPTSADPQPPSADVGRPSADVGRRRPTLSRCRPTLSRRRPTSAEQNKKAL